MADHTVRDLLERYEENKQDADPATAMVRACDEILAEMDGENSREQNTDRD